MWYINTFQHGRHLQNVTVLNVLLLGVGCQEREARVVAIDPTRLYNQRHIDVWTTPISTHHIQLGFSFWPKATSDAVSRGDPIAINQSPIAFPLIVVALVN